MVAGIAENETVVVADAEAGTRIDRVLAARTSLSRTRLKALILDGAVTIGPRTIRDPGHREIDRQLIVDLRHALTDAGYAPS